MRGCDLYLTWLFLGPQRVQIIAHVFFVPYESLA
jgi:hypothetical protein